MYQGPFNNYVRRMRGWGFKKCLFLNSGYKNCQRRGGGGQKMAKYCPPICWMPPYMYIICVLYFFVGIYNRFLLYNYCHCNWAFSGCKASIFNQQAQLKIPCNHHTNFPIRLCLQFAKIFSLGNWRKKM